LIQHITSSEQALLPELWARPAVKRLGSDKGNPNETTIDSADGDLSFVDKCNSPVPLHCYCCS